MKWLQLTYIINLSYNPFCDKKYSNVASKIFWTQSMLDFFFVYHTTLTLTLAMLCCNGKVLRAVRAIFALFFCIGKFSQKVFSFFFSFFLLQRKESSHRSNGRRAKWIEMANLGWKLFFDVILTWYDLHDLHFLEILEAWKVQQYIQKSYIWAKFHPNKFKWDLQF